MTTLRQAILLTADQFEQHPETYDFMSVKPPSCGTTGCIIGWVLHFLGRREYTLSWIAAFGEIMGVDIMAFYSRMNHLQPFWRKDWHLNAKSAAINLRKYADKYHN